MRLRTAAAVIAATAAVTATLAAPAHAEGTGVLTLHSLPGYEEVRGASGCHNVESRIVTLAEASPDGEYLLFGGPDCTGAVLGEGFDETQWIPALIGVRSAYVVFE